MSDPPDLPHFTRCLGPGCLKNVRSCCVKEISLLSAIEQGSRVKGLSICLQREPLLGCLDFVCSA